MKKLILFTGLTLLAINSYSQVIVEVEAPAGIAGLYVNTNPTTWSADMSNPANAVLDTVMVANDSLACNPLVNNLTGKIALVYRGSCEFGAKALAAQNAGAIAVIVVNNIAGAPTAMGAGAVGASVTIPVVMISQADGAIIRNQMITTPVVVFIGDKNGHYANDLGFQITDVLRADANGIPSQVAQNAAEFNTTVGAWVFNYGTADQTGITLNAKVNNGANIYDQTSNSFSLIAGDSAFITLPDFNQASYPSGTYTLNYAVNYGNTDGYTADNTVSTDFKMNDSIFSLSRLDAQGLPITTIGTRPATNSSSYSSCIVFNNANASRLGAAGIYFSASINAPDSLDGQEVLVTAYRWDDQFTDLNDANLGFTALTEMTSTSFYYVNNDLNIAKYQAFPEPFVMDDSQRYLFCVQTFNTSVFFGYDENSSYAQNESQDLQPLYPIESDGTYSARGFTSGNVPAIGVRVFDASGLGLNENMIETSSFPNPAKDVVTVKVNATGTAQLTVTDLAGRIVSTQEVKLSNGQFTTNVAGFNAGTYVFSLAYANGTNSVFKVVVTK